MNLSTELWIRIFSFMTRMEGHLLSQSMGKTSDVFFGKLLYLPQFQLVLDTFHQSPEINCRRCIVDFGLSKDVLRESRVLFLGSFPRMKRDRFGKLSSHTCFASGCRLDYYFYRMGQDVYILACRNHQHYRLMDCFCVQ